MPTPGLLLLLGLYPYTWYISDATILVFGIRYDSDTILPKYRDIDTISIFYK